MYVGQAVIEGVMIRGGQTYAVSARGLDGTILMLIAIEVKKHADEPG